MGWNVEAGLVAAILLGALIIESGADLVESENDLEDGEGNAQAPTPGPEDEDDPKKYHWAVLLAGSRYFWNYRHQADVCHAYQLLKADGIPEDQIITMVYDDIAHNYWQPYEYLGMIFNRPGGENVYPGCAKDYTYVDVTADVFYAVLSGNKEFVAGRGSGRVVEPHPKNRVFVFYSDHGASGLIGVPAGPKYIWADELTAVLVSMRNEEKFDELVFYLEACESGSMFENLLPSDIGVYGLSASNATESSWATYCPSYYDESPLTTSVEPNASYIGTCLGDLFSVSWMIDSETHGLESESLHTQYLHVFNMTAASADNGYAGSEVCQYGETSIDKEKIGNFLATDDEDVVEGKRKSKGHEFVAMFPQLDSEDPLVRHAHRLPWGLERVEQRDADLVFFMNRAWKDRNQNGGGAMLAELRKMLVERVETDAAVRKAVGSLIIRKNLHTSSRNLMTTVEEYVADPDGRFAAGKPVVDDWSCLRGMLNMWESQCGKLSDYSMKYTRTFASLCNAGISLTEFANTVDEVCGRETADRFGGVLEKPEAAAMFVS